MKGVTQLDVYTPETIQEKYGLVPDQIRDFLGLMGDRDVYKRQTYG